MMIMMMMILMMIMMTKPYDHAADTHDDTGHKKDSYTAAGAVPDAGAAPIQNRPDQTQKYCMLTLFWHEPASYKSCEALVKAMRF